MRNRGGALKTAARIISVFSFLGAAVLGSTAYLANQRRWHEGKKVIELWSSHGLHAMDLLLIAAAAGLLLVGMTAAAIARR